MEDIRAAALAYYGTGSDKLKQMASSFFESLDHKGDGKVMVRELVDFFKQKGYETIKPNFFKELGKDDEHGSLDFEEFMVVYYVVKTSWPSCQECGAFLKETYFNCVKCFDHGDSTYDLCTVCFGQGKTCTHKHTVFMDNHALLRSKSNASMLKMNKQHVSASASLPSHGNQLLPSHGALKGTQHEQFEALEKQIATEKFGMGNPHGAENFLDIVIKCSIM
ncbi:hypothetical protein F0562_035320 [Nyssa sinensis]|uniref:EF-hand domain-containing protein n=1 Tax=Nyssa sinensis TaxID=561372 RepID=A0A5J5AF11_9ASTE|nr:hypothetical protein F0562_035320 [Nyssa sinensis]